MPLERRKTLGGRMKKQKRGKQAVRKAARHAEEADGETYRQLPFR